MENLEKVNSLLSLIHDWVVTKGLHTHEPLYQLAKLNEEFGELNKAVLKNDTIKIIDGIGDVLVVCTVMATQFYNKAGVVAKFKINPEMEQIVHKNPLFNVTTKLYSYAKEVISYYDIVDKAGELSRRNIIEIISEFYNLTVLAFAQYAESLGIKLDEALNMALTTISFRSGEIVDGVFVKKEPNTILYVPTRELHKDHCELLQDVNNYAVRNDLNLFKIEFHLFPYYSHEAINE